MVNLDYKQMAIRLKSLSLVLVMAIGIMGGAPLTVPGAGEAGDHCLMKCCKKKVESKQENQTHRPNFCRLTDCSESVPAAPGSSNSTSSAIVFSEEPAAEKFHFVVSARPRAPGPELTRSGPLSINQPPVFILHHSLLI